MRLNFTKKYFNRRQNLTRMNYIRRYALLVISLSLFLFSCGNIDLFEKQESIPKQEWFYNNVPEFTFNIQDTVSLYNIYIVIRHTDQYNYNNIWLKVGSQFPGDSMQYKKLNLRLGTDAKGWEGVGLDDIFEVRSIITPGPVSFKKPGDYVFSIAQIMRENPLLHILNIGLRVEKVPH
ncbi:MAG: gliding motility lipoprotein GldH [Ginsengibacter sp.]